MDKRFINQEAQETQEGNENVLFKLADLDLDALLTQYITDNNYGNYVDYEVYKNYSLSRESWIDFIEVKVKPPKAKTPEDIICKYFGLVVLQGYLCSLDEINDPERLYFELYLEDILASSMVKSLKYDYLMMKKEQGIEDDDDLVENEKENNEDKEESIIKDVNKDKEKPSIKDTSEPKEEESAAKTINEDKKDDKPDDDQSTPVSSYLI